MDDAAERLKQAIRAFTIDAKDADGNLIANGPAEAALVKLCDRLSAPSISDDVADLIDDWLNAEADRTQALCQAAEAFFREDFHHG